MFEGGIGPLLTFLLIMFFSIIVGLFVVLLFSKLYPPKCTKCESREREEKLKAATKNEPINQISVEADL